MKRVLAILLFVVATATAVGAWYWFKTDPLSASDPQALDTFRIKLKRDLPLTFRSWNGKWIGMDCDTDIDFYLNGRVVMIEYALGINKYEGTYHLSGSNSIECSFPGYAHWPRLILRQDQTSLYLMPVDQEGGFPMSNREGATIPGDKGSFWPLRPKSTCGINFEVQQ